MGDFFDKVGTAPRGRPKGQRLEAPTSAEPAMDESWDATAGRAGKQRWASSMGTVFWGAPETYNTIPPGAYRCDNRTGIGLCLVKVQISTDQLLLFPDQASAEIVAEFDRFWIRKEEFDRRGFLHKRGFMLWGPPGSGKTSTLALMNKALVEDRKGIVIYIDHPGLAAGCLQMARYIEPSRPIIAVMEDLDALIERHGENEFLALLDGEAQVNSICFIATTNYPERLDWRFVDRPSRFDTIKEIGMPGAAARRMYLEAREPGMKENEREKWVRLSEGFSIAHLKELIVAVHCLGYSLEGQVNRLREMQERQAKSGNGADRPRAGFFVGQAAGWTGEDVRRAT